MFILFFLFCYIPCTAIFSRMYLIVLTIQCAPFTVPIENQLIVFKWLYFWFYNSWELRITIITFNKRLRFPTGHMRRYFLYQFIFVLINIFVYLCFIIMKENNLYDFFNMLYVYTVQPYPITHKIWLVNVNIESIFIKWL
jgi:hypothetical protein